MSKECNGGKIAHEEFRVEAEKEGISRQAKCEA